MSLSWGAPVSIIPPTVPFSCSVKQCTAEVLGKSVAPSSTSDVQAFSSFHEEEVCFRWTINNTKCVLRYLSEPLQSPAFTVPKITNKLFLSISKAIENHMFPTHMYATGSATTCESSKCHEFQLTLYSLSEPQGYGIPQGHLSLSNITGNTVYASKYSFSILGPLDTHTEKTGVDKLFIDRGVMQQITQCISVRKEIFEQCLHKDTITIQFKASLTFVTNPIHSVSQCAVVSKHKPNKQMKLMFEDELFTDVTIKAGEKTFNVHRAVLASHSDVFKTMFDVNMKEKREGLVTISDVSPEVMSDLLAYMYTGTAPNLKTLAMELIIAADKYNLPCLLDMCENELKMNLTPANVAEVLLVTDKLQLEARLTDSLKEACIKFIKHCSSVYGSESWKKLKETSLELAVETLESVACNN